MPRQSFRFLPALAATALLMLVFACSPTFDWRDVRLENTRLALLLPCKPDKATRTVPLGGSPVELTMLGCDAGGATFAVAMADLHDASKVAGALGQWQTLALLNMKAQPVNANAAPNASAPRQPQATQVVPLLLRGASSPPAAVLVRAMGQRADGTPVMGHAAYFAQGTQIFQAVIYAGQIAPETSETFFSSLKFE